MLENANYNNHRILLRIFLIVVALISVVPVTEVSRSCVHISVTGNTSGGILRPPQSVMYPCNRIVACSLKSNAPSYQGASAKKSSLAGVKTASGATAAGEGVGKAAKKVGSSSGGSGTAKCEVLLTCQGEQRFKDYILECEESVGQDIVDAIKTIKTSVLSNSNRQNDEEKPRRRYSLAGLKKKASGRHNSITHTSTAMPPPPH